VLLAAGVGALFPFLGRTQAQPAGPVQAAAVRQAAGAADKDAQPRPVPAPTTLKEQKLPHPKTQASSPAVAHPMPPAGTRLDAAALAQFIDQEVEARLAAEGIKPSPLADDAEFLRRAALDITGVIPSAGKAAAFLAMQDPSRRPHLIEELLADARFGSYLGEIWTDALVHRDSNNRKLKEGPLHKWLADAFNKNRPWDRTVYALLTASGTQAENGAVTFFLGNTTPDKVTDTVSRLFLGVQLQCAQCHDHPFTGWKRAEYWGMAGFFRKVQQSGNVKKAAKTGAAVAITEGNGPKGKKGKKVEVGLNVPPKFLQGEQPVLSANQPYRPVLAQWLTAPDNPFFARAMVNKTWAHFFGRGLVNPVDDMHSENAPSHPELLAVLVDQFKVHNFDVKYLVRAICGSRAYQRTSRPSEGNQDDTELFSHAAVRVLSPAQLYDSLTEVLGRQAEPKGPKGKKLAGKKKGGGSARDQFLAFFQVGDGASPLEYQAGIPQALRLMNSPQTNAQSQAIARAMTAGGGTPAGVIGHLYLTVLARRPSAAEVQRLSDYVAHHANPRAAYADVLWALVNSSEFALNH
jgi:hypothetical protein